MSVVIQSYRNLVFAVAMSGTVFAMEPGATSQSVRSSQEPSSASQASQSSEGSSEVKVDYSVQSRDGVCSALKCLGFCAEGEDPESFDVETWLRKFSGVTREAIHDAYGEQVGVMYNQEQYFQEEPPVQRARNTLLVARYKILSEIDFKTELIPAALAELTIMNFRDLADLNDSLEEVNKLLRGEPL